MSARIAFFRKISLATLIIFVLVITLYWVKGKIGINLFDSYSLSGFYPFSNLSGIIIHPRPGKTILDESFDSKFSLVRKWAKIWMYEKGRVSVGFAEHGRNNTRCLLIKSASSKNWAYSLRYYVSVKKGDRFSFEGYSQISGKDVVASFDVASFDQRRRVINWRMERSKVKKSGSFEKVKIKLTVPEGVALIVFRFTGSGAGEFRFDDIKVKKEV